MMSEEVEEILSHKPNWIVRNAIYLMSILLICLFSLSIFIIYPDVIYANLIISSINPPLKLVTPSDGKIESIAVVDNSKVKEGSIIAIIDNSADTEDVANLKRILEHYDTCRDLEAVVQTQIINYRFKLGELQPSFTELSQAFFAYKNFRTNRIYETNIKGYSEKLNSHRMLEKELIKKDTLLELQLSSENKKLKSNESLLQDKVIAPLEFEEIKKKYVDQLMMLEENQSIIIQNRAQQTEISNRIEELNNQKSYVRNDLMLNIIKSIKKLIGEISVWESKYIIETPVSGTVSFFGVWFNNQYVKAGDVIAVVTPPVSEIIVKANLPLRGAGKVQINQKVLIKLFDYPYQEYGFLNGKVTKVSVSALDSVYSIYIGLDSALKTSLNMTIPAQSELYGVAEIITQNKSIFERLTESINISRKRVE